MIVSVMIQNQTLFITAHSSFHDANSNSDSEVPTNEVEFPYEGTIHHGELFDHNIANPTELPTQGERVAFIDTDVEPNDLVEATVVKMHKSMKNKWPGWINVQRDDKRIQTSFNVNNTRWKRIQAEHALSSEDEIVDQFTNKNTGSSYSFGDTQNCLDRE